MSWPKVNVYGCKSLLVRKGRRLDRSSSWTDGPFAAQPVGCREHSGSGAGAKLLRYRNLADSSRQNVPGNLGAHLPSSHCPPKSFGCASGRATFISLQVRSLVVAAFGLTAISERGTANRNRGTPRAAVVTRPRLEPRPGEVSSGARVSTLLRRRTKCIKPHRIGSRTPASFWQGSVLRAIKIAPIQTFRSVGKTPSRRDAPIASS